MADLVTHLCAAMLPGAFLRWRGIPLVGIATVIPDLLGRAVPLGLEAVQGIGIPVPEAAIWPWGALHGPAGGLILGPLLAQGFVPADRRTVVVAVWMGYAVHLGLDVLQFHHGQGYPLLAPLDWTPYELGWIGSEATVAWSLPLLGITAVAWAVRTRRSPWIVGLAGLGAVAAAAGAGVGPAVASGAVAWVVAWGIWRRFGGS